jgi:hypothetical protein
MSSTFFLKPLVTIPVAPITTGVITHFIFHFHSFSIRKFFYFSFFSASCLCDISVRWYCHICQYACFLLLVFNYYIWFICCNFPVCVYPLIP